MAYGDQDYRQRLAQMLMQQHGLDPTQAFQGAFQQAKSGGMPRRPKPGANQPGQPLSLAPPGGNSLPPMTPTSITPEPGDDLQKSSWAWQWPQGY